jgi:MFS family permease
VRVLRAFEHHPDRRAGIFFLGYAVLQVPSNLILLRLGAPTWLGLTIVAWGVVAASFATLRSTAQFYILRFLLGIAECGAFPGAQKLLVAAGTSPWRTLSSSRFMLGSVLQYTLRYM